MNHKELLLKIKLKFSVVTVLIAVNILFYALTLLLELSLGPTHALRLLGAEYAPDILAGQLWRFVLPSFLHAGFFHLLLNMWALYHLGGAIETFYGQKKVFTVYVLTGLFGSILSVIVTLVRIYFNPVDETIALSVGSSAAVFGFVGLLIGNKFKKNTFSVSIDNYINTSQLWIFVILNLMFGLGINLFGSSFAINNFAHIGGFVSGFLLGMYLDLINTTYQGRSKKYVESFLFYLTILFVIISFLAEIGYVIVTMSV